MKRLALTIVVLMLALIAFGGSLSRTQNGQVSPKARDYRNVELFRGSEVGKYDGTRLRRLPFEPDEFALVWPCRPDLLVDQEPCPRRPRRTELLRVDEVFGTRAA